MPSYYGAGDTAGSFFLPASTLLGKITNYENVWHKRRRLATTLLMMTLEMEKSDLELLLNYRNGDQAAFLEFYRRHLKSVILLLRTKLASDDAVPSLAQEVFLRVHRHLPRFLQADNIKSYLLGLAYKQASMALRSLQRQNSLMEKAALIRPKLFQSCESGAGDEEAEALSQALFQLPAEERELLLLHYKENLSVDEIVKITNISRRSCYRKMEDAVARLKEILKKSF